MTSDDVSRLLSEFGTMIPSLNIDMEDLSALTQSRSAFLLLEEVPSTNNEHKESIVSKSDSSDQEIWNQGMSDVLGENDRKRITKRQASICRKAIRDAKKKIMERRLLKRKRSKKVSCILAQVPNVGKEIENFVQECGGGADA